MFAILLHLRSYLFGSRDCRALTVAGERERRVATGEVGGVRVCALGIGGDWVFSPCCAS